VLFVVGLVALGITVVIWAPVSESGLRDAIEPLGPAAPVGFVPLSALLGNAFVPGPVLAGAAGLLFGTAEGFLVAICASTLAAVLAVTFARQAGRPGMQELDAPRLQALAALAERHGTGAVIVQRLLPGVPDAPCSYLFGLAGVKAWQVALGTFVGSAPRAFSYVALGDAAGTRDTKLALVAGAVLLTTGLVGAGVGLSVLRRSRRSSA
jgi:uncharacterized membrane protein YdjX (TVP38/TMEM64 family)